MASPLPWTAVILAGGRGHRLGDVDKATVRLGGLTLLEHILRDLPEEVPVIVVSAPLPTSRPVTFVLEQPRFGGPVSGLAAALPLVRTPVFALLATDMPGAGALAIRLAAGLTEDDDVLMPVDADGMRQQLCSIVRTEAMRQALAKFATHDGVAMRAVMHELRVREQAQAPGEAHLLRDIDTPADLRAATDSQ